MIVIARRPFLAAGVSLGVPFAPTPVVGANLPSATSAAFNPPANSLLLAITYNRSNLAVTTASTITDNSGGALSWSALNHKIHSPGSGVRARTQVFGALIGASPPTGLTVTNQNSQARSTIQLLSITGPSAMPTNFDADDAASKNTSGDPVATLPSAPAASSYLIALFAGATTTDVAINPPTGGATYNEIEEAFTTDGAVEMQSCYSTGGTTTTATWSTTIATISIGSLIEIPQP